MWDASVPAALAAHTLLGGYAAGFAMQGGSKCVEVLEQVLDELEPVQCEKDDFRYLLSVPEGGAEDIQIVCVGPVPAIPSDEM